MPYRSDVIAARARAEQIEAERDAGLSLAAQLRERTRLIEARALAGVGGPARRQARLSLWLWLVLATAVAVGWPAATRARVCERSPAGGFDPFGALLYAKVRAMSLVPDVTLVAIEVDRLRPDFTADVDAGAVTYIYKAAGQRSDSTVRVRVDGGGWRAWRSPEARREKAIYAGQIAPPPEQARLPQPWFDDGAPIRLELEGQVGCGRKSRAQIQCETRLLEWTIRHGDERVEFDQLQGAP